MPSNRKRVGTDMKAYLTAQPVMTGQTGPATIADFSTIAQTSVKKLEPQRAILWLDADGYINDCNLTAVKVLGCPAESGEPLHVTALLPQLKEMKLNEGCHLNSHLRYIAHLGHRFEVFSVRGTRYEAELFFSEVDQPAPYAFRLILSLHHPVQRMFSVK